MGDRLQVTAPQWVDHPYRLAHVADFEREAERTRALLDGDLSAVATRAEGWQDKLSELVEKFTFDPAQLTMQDSSRIRKELLVIALTLNEPEKQELIEKSGAFYSFYRVAIGLADQAFSTLRAREVRDA